MATRTVKEKQWKRGVSGGATPFSRYVGKQTVESRAKKISGKGRKDSMSKGATVGLGGIAKAIGDYGSQKKKRRAARYNKEVRRGGAHSLGNKKNKAH